MKISIIIPVYNVRQYLEKCLDSVVHQNFSDFEVIVVNDGSTDDSQTIIDRYKIKFPNIIKSYVKENGGQGSARNFGLDVAIGKYILFLDSDDYLENNTLSELYNAVEKSKSDVLIFGNRVVDELGNIITNNYLNSDVLQNHFDAKDYVLYDQLGVCNKIYKKEYLMSLSIHFVEKLWYEDVAYTTKVLICTDNIAFHNQIYYNYLRRQGSTTNNSNVIKNLDIIAAFNDVIDFLVANNSYETNYLKLEFLALQNIYISTLTRIIIAKSSKSDRKNVKKQLKKYINDKFSTIHKNPYKKLLSTNRKIIYYLLRLNLDVVVKIIFMIK